MLFLVAPSSTSRLLVCLLPFGILKTDVDRNKLECNNRLGKHGGSGYGLKFWQAQKLRGLGFSSSSTRLGYFVNVLNI